MIFYIKDSGNAPTKQKSIIFGSGEEEGEVKSNRYQAYKKLHTMRNKPILILLIIFALGLTHKLNAQTLTGNWTLVCYSNLLTGSQDCKPPTDNTGPISLVFKDNGKIGTITGHTIVNKVTGEYTVLDSNKIKVESFGGTKVMEHGWGSEFWTTIRKSSSYKYSADTLVILYDNDNKAMKFLKTTK